MAILCVVGYKKRAFADTFVYLESLIRCMSCIFPNRRASVEYDEFQYLITNGMVFYTLASRPGQQSIVTTFLLGFQLFFGLSIAYERPLTPFTVVTYLGVLAMYLSIGSLFYVIMIGIA